MHATVRDLGRPSSVVHIRDVEGRRMVTVLRHEEIDGRGVFRFTVPAFNIEGTSRTPLLTACREIKAKGGPLDERAGIYRTGRDVPDIVCNVGDGADMAEQVLRAKYRKQAEGTS